MSSQPALHPTRSLGVLPADALRVSNGVNQNDAIGVADDLCLDDIYRLQSEATLQRLSIEADPESDRYRVAADTETGKPGATLVVDSTLTLMAPDGVIVETLVLAELAGGDLAALHLVPLNHMRAQTDYTLVGIDLDGGVKRLSELACVSFSRGTRITMASGAQVAVEDLTAGDRVLTRDDGPQEIRWVGMQTTRAVGAMAPVCITAGTLNNSEDLVISPDHRLFVYQRNDAIGAGRSEVLVKARHLVNGTSVYQKDGGFVDYFQILFDSHQIIYAEGIATESFLVDPHTRAAVSDRLEEALKQALPTHSDSRHRKFEIAESLLSEDSAERLRRASMG